MKPEFIPLYSALFSAAIAFLISWFSSRRTVRLEIDRLRLSTQQVAFSKLLEIRIREYPKLYSMLSDLLKALEGEIPVVDLDQLINRINKWDSQYAIFMDRKTSNTCYEFRKTLRAATSKSKPITNTDLYQAAIELELALRSDIGIHGIVLSGSNLSTENPRSYYYEDAQE